MAGPFHAGNWGAPPGAPAAGGGRVGLQQQTALIVAGVVAALLGIGAFIGIGLLASWLWGFVGFIFLGAAAFAVTFWMCIHPPQPRPPAPAPAAAAPPPAGGAVPAAAPNHTFIAVMVGCGTTVIASIIAVVAVSKYSDDGAFRTLAFLAPYMVSGAIGTRELFKKGN